jgi:hypothetical protein
MNRHKLHSIRIERRLLGTKSEALNQFIEVRLATLLGTNLSHACVPSGPVVSRIADNTLIAVILYEDWDCGSRDLTPLISRSRKLKDEGS